MRSGFAGGWKRQRSGSGSVVRLANGSSVYKVYRDRPRRPPNESACQQPITKTYGGS